MPSPIYQQFNGGSNPILGLIKQYKANPMGYLTQRFNIPQNVTDPNAIIQHLLSSGQIKQEQVDNAMRTINDPQFRSMFGGGKKI